MKAINWTGQRPTRGEKKMGEEKTPQFEPGQAVMIKLSKRTGIVEYAGRGRHKPNPQYLIEYADDNGAMFSRWFDESDIEALKPEAEETI